MQQILAQQPDSEEHKLPLPTCGLTPVVLLTLAFPFKCKGYDQN